VSGFFMAELRLFGCDFAPKGWAQCNGQILPINQNQPLFALLGTQYGGNGQTTFALPDLRNRIPIHQSGSRNWGEKAGSDAVTINIQQLPQHIHFLSASPTAGNTQAPSNNFLARNTNNIYAEVAALTTLHPQTVSSVGGSQPHENRQPFLTLNFCIALQGVFPSRN
jgi:microcystin-dependent protein